MKKVNEIERKLKEIIASLPPGTKLEGERTLAKKLGVSPSSVGKVLQILEREGLVLKKERSGTFVADKSAFAGSETETITFIMPLSLDEFGYRIIRGMHKKLKEMNLPFKISVLFFEDSPKPENISQKVVILPPQVRNERTFSIFKNTIPQILSEKEVVFVDRVFTEGASAVVFANEEAGRALAKFAKKKGTFKKILLVADTFHAFTSNLRFEGFRKEMKEVNPHIEYAEGFIDPSLLDKTKAELIIASDDFFAIKLLLHLLKNGIKVPKEIKFASFGGFHLLKKIPIKVTSVKLPIEKLGEKAIELLFQNGSGIKTVKIEPEGIKEGESL